MSIAANNRLFETFVRAEKVVISALAKREPIHNYRLNCMQNIILLLETKQSRTSMYAKETADAQILFKRSLHQEGFLLTALKVRT
jgi:hypothetical protein